MVSQLLYLFRYSDIDQNATWESATISWRDFSGGKKLAATNRPWSRLVLPSREKKTHDEYLASDLLLFLFVWFQLHLKNALNCVLKWKHTNRRQQSLWKLSTNNLVRKLHKWPWLIAKTESFPGSLHTKVPICFLGSVASKTIKLYLL